MKNENISSLFSSGGGEIKSVTLSISSGAYEIASRNANALRLSRRRWLELLIENVINEYSELGGDNEKGSNLSEDLVPSGRVGSNQIHSEDEGYIGSEFDSLRNNGSD